MDKPDYKKARREAEMLLEKLGYDSPPVSPIDIAASFGINVYVLKLPEEQNNVAGFIDFDRSMIVVNEYDTGPRQIFTIAHELGHYILHKEIITEHPHLYKILYRNNMMSNDSKLEKEANAFAASLLVPTKELKKLKDHMPQRLIASVFGVSPEVIKFRINSLNW